MKNPIKLMSRYQDLDNSLLAGPPSLHMLQRLPSHLNFFRGNYLLSYVGLFVCLLLSFLHYEKLTNLGSLGKPSGPILFLANRPSVCILLASSKFTLRLFIIFWISLLLLSSNPRLESPEATFPDRSKADDDKPFSISAEKEEGRRE